MTRITRIGAARAVVVFGLLLALPFVFSDHWIVNIAFFGLMFAVLAVAWNLLGGYAGYIWLGSVGFFGIGAYTLAIIYQHLTVSSGYEPFFMLVPLGIGIALASVPLALLLFRVRAATFAVVSLAVLFVAEIFAFNLDGITGGAQGLGMALPPFAVGTFERPFYLVMLVLLAVVMLSSWYLAKSKFGLMLFAIRGDEDRARGLGVRTTSVKVIAFALCCGFTAMAGGLWGYYITYLYPQFAMDPNTMFAIVLMTYLGGKGTLWGPVVGAFIVAPAKEYLAYTLGASELYLIGYAVLFLGVMFFLPRGIIPTLADFVARRRHRTQSLAPGQRTATDQLA